MDSVNSAPPAAIPAEARSAGTIVEIVRLLRPHHWTKNLLCLAGVVFSGQYLLGWALRAAFETAGVFCAAASAIYVLNDLVDRDRDRAHPVKKNRPLASGAVGIPAAVALGLVLLAVALAGSAALSLPILVCVGLYLGLNFAYTLWLKHVPLLDVLSIALGFVLRMAAGVYAVRELPTAWITLCTFFLSLFLAFTKRRSELAAQVAGGAPPRPVLAQYSLNFLDQMVAGAGVLSVMCYALFTTTSGKNLSLLVTVPIVVYGIMHYHRISMDLKLGQEPERILLKDVRIQACLIAWLASYLAILRFNPQLFR